MATNDAIDTLNHLISIAKDGYNGMNRAAEAARDPQLKNMISTLSQERNRVATDLQQTVQRLGGDPSQSGTVSGTLHRTFMDIKDNIVSAGDNALVEECERGEDYAMQEFKEALAKDLPPDAKQAVQNAYSQVQKSHQQFSQLKRSGKQTSSPV
jgi:uncharacterized protein (TIGR02284 family)